MRCGAVREWMRARETAAQAMMKTMKNQRTKRNPTLRDCAGSWYKVTEKDKETNSGREQLFVQESKKKEFACCEAGGGKETHPVNHEGLYLLKMVLKNMHSIKNNPHYHLQENLFALL